MMSWFERTKWPVHVAGTSAYAEVGRKEYGRPYLRLWLPQPDIDGETIQFPRALIIERRGGGLVARPSDQHLTYDILLRCGYRGGAMFTIEGPTALVERYERWESERGNLGVSAGALICVRADQPLPIIWWERTGRLYGDPPSGCAQLQTDGSLIELPPDDAI
jgi:hypothetical protein